MALRNFAPFYSIKHLFLQVLKNQQIISSAKKKYTHWKEENILMETNKKKHLQVPKYKQPKM